MKIIGFQKLTLLDFPNKVACTLFLGGCNLRCPFCQNSALVLRSAETPEYTREEILEYLKKRQGILEGVAVTGGEPLINKDIDGLLTDIKSLGYPVKLDTNGCYPDKLIDLVKRELVDYVAMDVKNCLQKYPVTTGVPDFDTADIKRSVDFLLSGSVDYEFRTTVVKEFHTKEDFIKIGELIRGAKKYYLQAFVDSGDLISNGLHGYGKEELSAFVSALEPFVQNVALRGE